MYAAKHQTIAGAPRAYGFTWIGRGDNSASPLHSPCHRPSINGVRGVQKHDVTLLPFPCSLETFTKLNSGILHLKICIRSFRLGIRVYYLLLVRDWCGLTRIVTYLCRPGSPYLSVRRAQTIYRPREPQFGKRASQRASRRTFGQGRRAAMA